MLSLSSSQLSAPCAPAALQCCEGFLYLSTSPVSTTLVSLPLHYTSFSTSPPLHSPLCRTSTCLLRCRIVAGTAETPTLYSQESLESKVSSPPLQLYPPLSPSLLTCTCLLRCHITEVSHYGLTRRPLTLEYRGEGAVLSSRADVNLTLCCGSNK